MDIDDESDDNDNNDNNVSTTTTMMMMMMGSRQIRSWSHDNDEPAGILDNLCNFQSQILRGGKYIHYLCNSVNDLACDLCVMLPTYNGQVFIGSNPSSTTNPSLHPSPNLFMIVSLT